MSVEYVRIVSWHIVRHWSRMPGRAITLCGRSVDNAGRSVTTDLPAGKSCEVCLRHLARKVDDE